MPTYEYICRSCTVSKSIVKPITEAVVAQVCDKCDLTMARLYQLGAVTFKGAGFYVNE
jgi:putative FmdB family regulatory protein